MTISKPDQASAPSTPQQRIRIRCDANSTDVFVPEDAIRRSKLLQSLSDEALGNPTSGNAALSVPFRKQDVEAWLNFDEHSQSRSLQFSGCAATLKVADFLHDEGTVLRAAAEASVLLFSPVQKAETARCMHGPSKSWKDSSKVCDEDVQDLLALDARLAETVLRSMDALVTAGPVALANENYHGRKLGFWLQTLPPSCHAMAVAAAVDPQDCSLRLKAPSDSHDTVYHSHMHDIIAEITERQNLPTLTLALEGFAMGSCSPSFEPIVDFGVTMGALRDLECMELMQCTVPTVPSTLTALTRLAVLCEKERDNSYCFRDFRIRCDVAQLTALQDLWLVGIEMRVCDLNNFCSALPNLQALSSLKFIETIHNSGHIPKLANAIACCTSLVQLSLANNANWDPVPGYENCFTGFSGLTNLTELNLKNSWALCSTAAHILPHVRQLLHLDLSFKPEDLSEESFADSSYEPRVDHDSQFSAQLTVAISQLKQLRYFRASRALLEMNSHDSLFIAALPKSLLELTLAPAPACAPTFGADVARLTQLEALHLMFETPGLPLEAVRELSSLQQLRVLCITNPLQQLDLEAEETEELLTVLPASIEGLYINTCEFPAEACKPLSSLSALSSLMIGSAEDTLTDDVALSLAHHLPKLTSLQHLSFGFWGCYVSAAAKSALQDAVLNNISHVGYGMCVDLQF